MAIGLPRAAGALVTTIVATLALGCLDTDRATGSEARDAAAPEHYHTGLFPPQIVRVGGNVMVVWPAYGVVDELDVVGQRLNADTGQAMGEPFVINRSTHRWQRLGDTAVLEDGTVIVVWHSEHDRGLFGQRLKINGAKIGPEFRLHPGTGSRSGGNPTVAALSGGGFVVTWTGYGGLVQQGNVYGQIFHAAGGTVGGVFSIAQTRANEFDVDVAPLANGGFVAAWMDQTGPVLAQRFSAAGAKVGSEIAVGTALLGPRIAGLKGGGFVVAWTNNDDPDYGADRVRIQRYAADGTPSGAAFWVKPNGEQTSPAITGLSDGGFVVAWSEGGTSFSTNHKKICGRQYTRHGAASGSEFCVGSVARGFVDTPAIVQLGAGKFAIAYSWEKASGAFVVVAGILDLTDEAGPSPRFAPFEGASLPE